MPRCLAKDAKTIVCIVLASVSVAFVVTLLTLGAVVFIRENTKVLNYVGTMCQVNSGATKTYRCTRRYSQYTCYGAIWEVHHGAAYTTLATVEDDERFRSNSDATARSQQYKVGKLCK
jgi:hypothetical protein